MSTDDKVDLMLKTLRLVRDWFRMKPVPEGEIPLTFDGVCRAVEETLTRIEEDKK